jgi:acetyltransferase-like isoleucine patch superfamily enzyme
MAAPDALRSGAGVATGLLASAAERLRGVARYLVWQWRAQRSGAVIRSSQVSLSARLGQRVRIGPDVFFDGASRIGDCSYVNQYSSVENASIGRFCSIARGVMIGPAEHDYTKLSTHPFWYQPFYGYAVRPAEPASTQRPTLIGDDVWIGCNVVVRAGVSVQRGAVIGAGSVVTRDVGPYEIWAGVPARKIKQRFDDATIAALLALDWCGMERTAIDREVIPAIGDIAALARLAPQAGLMEQPGPTWKDKR